MRLGRVLKRWRVNEELGLREAGKLMGVSAVTLMRVEKGHDPSGETLARIFRWLTTSEKKDRRRGSR